MSVVTSYEDAGPCRKRLTIEVPAPAVEAESGRVVQELSRNLRLPGFRKGKAPASMIRKRFGDDVKREVVERLVPRYWRQAQAEKNIDPLLPPEISDLEVDGDGPMTFTAAVEVRPEFDLQLEPAFELPEESTDPTDEEIDEQIDELRRAQASWNPVERPAAVGDRVSGQIQELPDETDEADGEGAEDGDETEEPSPNPFEIEVGDDRVWEEMSLALTGSTAGRTITFDHTTGEGEQARTRHYRADVEAVKEQELPPIDDELAKQAGEFDDLAALREAIVDGLTRQKQDDLRRRRQQGLREQLRTRHPLALPQRLVDQELETVMRDYLGHLGRQGIDPGQLDFDRLGEQARPDAEHRVHERLVLDAVVEELDIQVDEEAFEGLLAMIAARQKQSPLALRQELSESGRIGPIRAQLKRDRAVRVLLGEEEASEDEAPAEGTEAGAEQE